MEPGSLSFLILITYLQCVQSILWLSTTRFQPERCSAVLWTPIFGRNTRKIHLISHTFTGKREFWTASFQCLAKSLVHHHYKADKLLFVVVMIVVVAAFKLQSSLKFIRQHLEVAFSYHFFTWVHVVYFSDMDECVHTLEYLGCSPNSFCINFIGSFFCACKEGYLGDGRTCQSKFWVNLTVRLF